MKKRDSWDSEFRKQRFYYNREKKALKKYFDQIDSSSFASVLHTPRVNPKRSIAIMLDLDGTSNWIDDSSAEIFMKQVENLRKHFGEGKAFLCISTHAHGSEAIKKVLDKLAPFANENIILDNAFFYGGVYAYPYDTEYHMGNFFNTNKIKTFAEHYLESEILNIGWCALIDDTISERAFKGFQNEIPMVAMKPGCTSISKYTNFMYRETCTDNFDGVIELMDSYINDIKEMDYWDILDFQREMVRHLSDFEIHDLIKNREFYKLREYLKSGMTDESDFKNTFGWLMFESKVEPFGAQYDSYVEDILNILRENKAFTQSVSEVKALMLKNGDM